MKANVWVSRRILDSKLRKLSSEQRKVLERNTVYSSALILKNKSDQLFTSRTKLRKNSVSYRSDGKKKTKNVELTKIDPDKKEPTVKVHILGNFKAKWFEKATKARYTKGSRITGTYTIGRRTYKRRTGKASYRGRMLKGKPLRLFATAARATESKILSNMHSRMLIEIKRLFK